MKGKSKMKSTFKGYDELPLILTVADISGILGMSLNNCYNLIKTPGFPVIYVSKRKMVIPKDKFIAWMDKQVS